MSRTPWSLARGLGPIVLVSLLACTSKVGGGSDSTGGDGAGGTGGGDATDPVSTTVRECVASDATPPALVRRLTRREYNNTVRDLLGDDTSPAQTFVVDARPEQFEDNSASPVTALMASQYADAADKLASTTLSKRPDRLAACVTASPDDDCAKTVARDFGKRAWRRPLTDTEQTRLFGIYKASRTAGDAFTDGVQVMVSAMLQSPYFVNHVERGGTPKNGVVALTPYERAARLSYFLLGTMPDQALFDAADGGGLDSPADVEVQTLRLLDDPNAKTGVRSFFQQWLRLDKLDELDRNTTLFPQWNPALRDALRGETEAFVDYVMWQDDAKMTTLFTAPYSFTNQALAAVYDAKGPTGTAFVRTDLDPGRRAGLLTQGSLLAMTAHYEQTSPVQRGLAIREKFMCQHMPSPPANVNVSVPAPTPGVTTRQRFEQHRSDPYCASCHSLMDPIGVGFENYDPIGKYRTSDNGKTVDAAGEISGSQDLDGAFNGAVELAGKLAQSRQVEECMTSLWIAYGTGAAPGETTCAAAAIADDFHASGTDIKGLIVAITKSSAFLSRRAPELEACQ